MNLFDIEFKTAQGQLQTLKTYEGKVILIVNVASECGYTKQYQGLQNLYQVLGPRGLTILGFPCNQFGGQEPGTDAEIQTFCEGRFGVKFPILSKIDVNGPEAHPLFQELKAKAPGILGTEGIKWNFTKFLIDRSGKVVKRFAPQDEPEKMMGEISSLL